MKTPRYHNKSFPLNWILLVWIVFACVAVAGEGADAVGSRMINVQHIEGEFSQQRYISVLSAPLQSSGTFSYDRDAGVTWKTLLPIANLVRIDPLEGVLAGQSEQTVQKLTSSHVAAQIFLGLFSGNLDYMHSMFIVTDSGTANHWQLEFLPKDKRLAEYIASIRVGGGEFVETIVLLESNGDRSEIALHVSTAR